MAKYYNNQKKTGRVAGSVFAIRYGETIERAYNPVVANPNTPNQVAARAILKLGSQLAAVLAPAIAIPREGALSPRNLFIRKNYGLMSYEDNEAQVEIDKIQLTKSVVGLPPISGTRNATQVSVALGYTDPDIDKVVYVFLVKNDDETLRLNSSVVAEAGAQGDFATTASVALLPTVVLAYGIRENTDAARVAFGDLVAPSAEDVAKLIVTRTLLDTDVTLTETRGAIVPVS